MEEAIKFFTEGNVKITGSTGRNACEVIRREAAQHGLSAQDLIQLCTIVGKNSRGVKTSKFLLRCMIPREDVPGEAVMRLLPRLGKQKIPNALEVEILKWLTAVFHLVSKDTNLVVASRVLFPLLENAHTSEHASTLLVLMASKSTATGFSLRMLERIEEKHPSSEHIRYLVQVFKNYDPGSVPIMDSELKNEEKKHLQRLKKLRAKLMFRTPRPVTDSSSEDEEVPTSIDMSALKLSKGSPLDMSCLLNNLELDILSKQQSVQLTDWVFCSLHDAFFSPEDQCADSTLLTLATLATRLGENLPGVEKFLCKYIPFWDGHHHASTVFTLVSKFPLSSRDRLFQSILDPIHQIFLFGSVEKQHEILVCLTELCRHWISLNAVGVDGRSDLIFDRDASDSDCVEPDLAIQSLLEYVDSLMSLLPAFYDDMPINMLLVILDFYTMLLDTHEKFECFVCDIPEWSIIVACFYSSSLLCLDRFCEFLLRCQRVIQKVKQDLELAFVQDFNECLTWVTSSFGTHDWRATRNVPNFTRPVRKEALLLAEPRNEAFSLWRHPALHLHIRNFCEQEKITVDELKTDLELLSKYLEYLSPRCPSVVQLVHQSALRQSLGSL